MAAVVGLAWQNVLQQWTNVHRLTPRPHVEHEIHGHSRRVWWSGDNVEVIEAIGITGMPHGVPLAASGMERCGHVAPFHFDVGLSSTHHIARFWGLTETAARHRADHAAGVLDLEPVESAPLLAAHSVIPYVHHGDDDGQQDRNAYSSASGRADPRAVIAAALKAAGLLGQPTGNPLDPRRVITSALRAAGVLKD
jgi:hypothetical protein